MKSFTEYTQTDIAKRLNVTRYTVSRWKNDGCPMHSFEEFYKWVCGNKKANVTAIHALRDWKRGRDSETGKLQDESEIAELFGGEQQEGSEYELVRLSSLALQLAKEIDKARVAKDEALADTKLDQYIKVVTAQKQLDSMLSKDRREAGESVNKEDMEAIFTKFGLAICFAE